MAQRKPLISWEDFQKIDLRAGTVTKAQNFPEARIPAYQLWIDFGSDIGELKTSAQITQNYTPEGLVGMQVLAVVNFPPKQIGPFMSECLVTGIVGVNGDVVLAQLTAQVRNGDALG